MSTLTTRVSALRHILGEGRFRWLGVLVGIAYTLVYLYSLGQLVIDRRLAAPAGTPAVLVHAGWLERLTDRVAGYTFEPVAALYLIDGVALFIAPANLLIGLALGGLVALNVISAALALMTRSCRSRSAVGLLGTLPGLMTGFACCAPSVALLLGGNLTLTLIGMQGLLLPLSFVALLAGLLWNASRIGANARAGHAG